MKFLLVLILLVSQSAFAQSERDGTSIAQIQKVISETMANKWYERIQLKGYADFRYNRIGETNSKLKCTLCDGSIGDKQGFFMRRARLTFFGDVNDRIFIYIQPDYATNATATNNNQPQQNYFQIRDMYFDYHLTEDKEWRMRFGQSKVPFGFENLQSSGLRTAFDRTDAINSGIPNERDTGIFLMYAPTEIRQRFKELATAALKGSGDYGMISAGVYNGQSMDRPERNNGLHRSLRFTYPHKMANGQFVEVSAQAYEGDYNTFDQGLNKNFYDARQGYSFIYYPQPIGFQAEYNNGLGPQFDSGSGTIKTKNLSGGYALMNYQYNYQNHRIQPFVRYQNYKGGKKLMNNAEFTKMNEWELGTEWQPHAAFELTVAYALSDRLTQSSNDPTNTGFRSHQKGNLLRVQAQFNY